MGVSEIDDYRPHFVVPLLNGNVHVLPVSLVRDWISGKQDMFNEDNRAVIQKILDEWLDNKIGE